MCRNIRTLYHFDPPVTDDEIRAASLQFVRKVSGFTKPSAANQEAFDRGVAEVSETVHRLLDSLVIFRPGQEPRGRGGEGQGAGSEAIRLAIRGLMNAHAAGAVLLELIRRGAARSRPR